MYLLVTDEIISSSSLSLSLSSEQIALSSPSSVSQEQPCLEHK